MNLIKRFSKTGANDLNTVYRPHKVGELFGNEPIKKLIKNTIDSRTLRHSILISGDSGCGKTTLARIIALSLNCFSSDNMTSEPCLECDSCRSILNNNSPDVIEINVGESNLKSDAASLANKFQTTPLFNRYKVYILDEAHEFTSAAQDLLLKPTEDGNSHLYLIFCTNQPKKLKDTFLRRVSTLNVKRLADQEIKNILVNVSEFEGYNYNHSVLDLIVDNCQGVPGKALVMLETLAGEGSWDLNIAVGLINNVESSNVESVFDLARCIVKGDLVNSIKIYDNIKNTTNLEFLKITLSSYISSCITSGNKNPKEILNLSECMLILTEPLPAIPKIAMNHMLALICKAIILRQSSF